MKQKLEINDISELNDYCSDYIDEFLEPLRENPIFCKRIDTESEFEYYGIDPDDCSGIWKSITQNIVENAIRRYGVIAEKMFPEDIDYFEVNCSNYREY
jgi:hypothetical protein